MSEIAAEAPAAAKGRRTPRASLGSAEGDDIFGTFDPNVVRRFLTYLKPHRNALIGAQVAVIFSAATQMAIPKLVGEGLDKVLHADIAGLNKVLMIFAAVAIS